MALGDSVGIKTVEQADQDATKLVSQANQDLSSLVAQIQAMLKPELDKISQAAETIAGVLAKGYTITITVEPKK